MLNWLRRVKSITADQFLKRKPKSDQEPKRLQDGDTLRRFESAATHRLNAAHWAKVTDQPINADIATFLNSIRARCEYEAFNSPMADGVITTHATDFVDVEGPTLEVVTSDDGDKAYGEKLEQLWEDFWQDADVTGVLSGPDMLLQWIRGLWTTGEFLFQVVTDNSVEEGVKIRIKSIHPRRLKTPPKLLSDPNVTMGVRRNRFGKPIEYYIENEKRVGDSVLPDGTFKTLKARHVFHRFLQKEADQVRGVPLLNISLNGQADLRDFDQEVLDCQRQAANFGVILATNDPRVPPVTVDESVSVDFERGQVTTSIPGWTPHQIKPEQPSTEYLPYRAEKHREIGMCVNMPLMISRHDASKHNFSSARFDSKRYERALGATQGWLKRKTLNPLVALVEREGALANRLPKRRPSRVTLVWTWPVLPPIDEVKDAASDKLRLADGTDSKIGVARKSGKKYEVIARQRARAKEIDKSLGLDESEETDKNKKGTPKMARVSRLNGSHQ